ncbi:MAG: ABC transporter permease subunit [Rubrivivax sp.]|nr:ABC transporter permease subunit [Rubrivivax sp.]
MSRCLQSLLRSWPALLLAVAGAMPAAWAAEPVTVGSKRFTESYVLGELVVQTLQAAGVPAQHRQGLGNTGILEQALASGAVQVYPEYTGTIVRELLKRDAPEDATASLAQINAWLAPRGLKAAVPLGFNNTYALAMREDDAARLGLATISDLARLPAETAARLRPGLSHEFLVRADGWPALRRAYGLALRLGSGLDHGLAYEALARGQVDLIDVYSTDAKIGRLKLRVLRDDRAFFPRYDAVLLMRAGLDEAPLAAALAGRIDEATMIALNAEVEIDGRGFAEVARDFLARSATAATAPPAAPPATAAPAAAPRAGFVQRLLAPDLGRLLGQHLALVFGSLALAVAAGVPLGVWAFRRPALAGVLMGAVGVLQTVPSLALLAVLIALLGVIGFWPALLALFVYALLPIVRNTHAGLAGVPRELRLAAAALGLRPRQVLRAVELPLAWPTLLAGVKTAAVINVGTATVAAFIGAGGLGERIVAGLAVNDATQMMAGAVPAALLAIAVQAIFGAVERLPRWQRQAARESGGRPW